LQKVKWGEFIVKDLFSISNTLSFNSEVLINGDEYDYITRTSYNQGILQTTGFVNEENINPAGNWSLGLLQMDFFYRKKPWYAGQFIRKVTPKFELSDSAILFFTTLLNKLKPNLLSVLVRDVDKTFLNSTIKLPITTDGKIDFTFIAEFVAELEAQRVAELETYLHVTGLKDYVLSEEEQNILYDFEFWDWGIFNVKSLYGASTRGKRLKSEDRINGDLPFVTAGEANEGISAFIGNKVEVFNANTTTIDMFGSAKYRNYKYGGDDHIAVVHTENIPKMAAIFVTTAIHKSSHNGQFDYSRNFYAKDADKLKIKLPICEDKPNYSAMKLLITAIHKLIIKDIVMYADRKISGTKYIINNNRID
jgi:hypothetical protein